jgi:hypothetical protein
MMDKMNVIISPCIDKNKYNIYMEKYAFFYPIVYLISQVDIREFSPIHRGGFLQKQLATPLGKGVLAP